MRVKTEKPLPDVRSGQIWKDNDKRVTWERRLRVLRVEGRFAFCERIFKGVVAKGETRIALTRFRPTSTGYALEA